MKKFLKIFIKILPFLLLTIVSLVPVYYTLGKLAIGGDTILPFNPEGVEKFLWQWYGSENGQYLTQNLVPLFLIYKISSFFSLSLTTISAILFFCLNFLSGLAIFKLCNLIYKPNNALYLSFPVIFYVLSPAILNGWHYCFIYAFAPWFAYVVIKILITRRARVLDLVLANVVIFFASVDLPNPKYLMFLYLFAFVLMVFALFLRIISIKSITRNWWKIILFFLYSFYLLLPLTFFATNYSPENYAVHIRQNYADSGLFMDQGSSTINKMTQLHHSGENINSIDRTKYNKSKKIVLAGSVFFICIVFGLLFGKRSKKLVFGLELIFLAMICLFLFFAVGPNPPFGFLYRAMVSNIGVLAFLRTTAGAVFFLSIFYSILLFGFIENLRDKNKLLVTLLLFIALFTSSYPLIDGKFYENLDVVGNKTIDKKSYGINLPTEYFEAKKIIDQMKIDGKLLNIKNNLSYINTNWGYFGPSIYNYLFDYYNIGFNNIISRPENHSVAYTIDDKSLYIDKTKPIINVDRTTSIIDNNILNLSVVSSDNYLPHFWTPTKLFKEDYLIGDLSEDANKKPLGEAVYLKGQNDQYSDVLDNLAEVPANRPNLEYRKINPTKYRVRIHKAKTVFPLIFNETFNKYWKIYPAAYQISDKQKILMQLEKYLMIKHNDNFQATKDEVQTGIENNIITSLGDDRGVGHNSPIFISKEMFGTIQNDNLKVGSLFETIFQKPIFSDSHLVANGYANSWLINPDYICGQPDICQKNSNGSYDFEIIVEFLPQRIFWFGLFITLVTVLVSVLLVIIIKIRKAKNR